uniref:C-type lectin domain-containing protein n=1 Tax=Callorhinchus milii TaxID=7868 RepID=A0A4W3GY98_CALMI
GHWAFSRENDCQRLTVSSPVWYEHLLFNCSHSDGLAEVYSEELHRYLVEVTGVNRVWFGVTKCGSNWCLTGSNQPVSYTKWGSGEPSNRILAYEYCAELHSDHKWNSISCSSSKYYVCQECKSPPILFV